MPGSTQPSFLVVEDEVGVRRLLGRGLASHGQVETVGTCAAARMSLRVRQYHALIVDVDLPDGSGLDLIGLAAQRSPGIVIVVLTGSTDHDVIGRTLREGARYLLKPFDTSHLKALAEEVTSRALAGERRIQLTLDRWAADLALSKTEVELLALGASGVPRDKFSSQRGVRPDTIRKQIQALLQKTGDDSFEGAVNSLLREAVAEPT
jgi:two-component system, NarL family, response regulator DevR